MTVSRVSRIAAVIIAAVHGGVCPAAQPATPPDPSGAYKVLRSALEAGDTALAAQLFAQDAIAVGGPACIKEAPCKGKEAIRLGYVAYFALAHMKVTVLDEKVNGDTAVTHAQIASDLVRTRGIERVVINVVTKVRDGQIVSIVHSADLSDPATAAYFSMNPPRLSPR